MAAPISSLDPIVAAMELRSQSFIAATQLIIQQASDTINSPEIAPSPLLQKLKAQELVHPSGQLANFAPLKTNAQLLQENLKTIKVATNQKDLIKLQAQLIDLINCHVYRNLAPFKRVKEQLDNAENHICWKQRNHKTTKIADPITQQLSTRTETPIAWLTNEQQDEWLSILLPNPPRWFVALADWEQNYLKQQITLWQTDPAAKGVNLGEYLGSVPSTIRRYPGAANAYITNYKAADPRQTFDKIRMGFLVPFDVAYQEGKIRLAKQNIEQLLVISVANYIVDAKLKNPNQPVTIDLPFLIQTLHSPPLQPEQGVGSNNALFAAIDLVRQQLTADPQDPDKLKNYFDKLGLGSALQSVTAARIKINIDQPQALVALQHQQQPLANVNFAKIDIITANRPVNIIKGVTRLLNFVGYIFTGDGIFNGPKILEKIGINIYIGRQYRENANTNKILAQRLQIAGDAPEVAIAKSALAAFQARETSLFTPNLLSNLAIKTKTWLNTFFPIFLPGPKQNIMAEQAALEQIITGKIGIRIGSCISGKDREEMVTMIAIGMTEFYAKYGAMPPQAGSKGKDQHGRALDQLRAEFVANIAEQFLSRHGHELAGANAAGCDGLKNVKDVLSSDVCKQIRALAASRGLLEDPIKVTTTIAGINKIGVKKLAKALDKMLQQAKISAPKSATNTETVSAPKENWLTKVTTCFFRQLPKPASQIINSPKADPNPGEPDPSKTATATKKNS